MNLTATQQSFYNYVMCNAGLRGKVLYEADIMKSLNISHGTIFVTRKQLSDMNLIRFEKDGRSVKYFGVFDTDENKQKEEKNTQHNTQKKQDVFVGQYNSVSDWLDDILKANESARITYSLNSAIVTTDDIERVYKITQIADADDNISVYITLD